jgi:hypothetical protein
VRTSEISGTALLYQPKLEFGNSHQYYFEKGIMTVTADCSLLGMTPYVMAKVYRRFGMNIMPPSSGYTLRME